MSFIHIERYFLIFYKEYRLQTLPQEYQSMMIKKRASGWEGEMKSRKMDMGP